MPCYGLAGKKLGHSFSKAWFTSKFEREGLTDYRYINHEMDDIRQIRAAVQEKGLSGLNITVPFKSSILPYLDVITEDALTIGAVNVVKVHNDGRLFGYNTDHIGFRETLMPLLKECHSRALILGTGGAAKAIAYVLSGLGIEYQFVSRDGTGKDILTYKNLTMLDIRNAPLIVNTSPAGMFPEVSGKPDIPYEGVDKYHILYDLVYNPAETEFMKMGDLYGAQVINGYAMLVRQAEESWKIWMDPDL